MNPQFKTDKLETLQMQLDVQFKDASLLEKSLVHRSYLNEIDDNFLDSNERLEFLGDALLGLVVTQKIYLQLPDLAEGDLTKVRASLVRMETLARIAESLNLGEYLLLGKGEDDSGGRARPRNLACAMEAVIGAVFVDQGFSAASEFVLRILEDEIDWAMDGNLVDDSKSILQEMVQAVRQTHPVYNIVGMEGPDHDRKFTVDVCIADKVIGQGSGTSKRSAEQAAAGIAIEKLEAGEKLD